MTHYLRKEIIKALGNTRGGLSEVKGGKAVGPAAYGLLRVLTKTPTLSPPPSFKEKIEAAIGIGQIKVGPNSKYKPDWGFAMMARLLNEFATKYKSEQIRRLEFGSVPWKVYAARLLESISEMQKNVGVVNAANAGKLARLAEAVLEPIEAGKPARDIRDFNIQQLSNLANTLKPKDQEVFKGAGAAPFKLD